KKGKIRMTTEIKRDGKADWDLRLGENNYTYSEAQSLFKREHLGDIKAEQRVWEGYFDEAMGAEFLALSESFIKPMPNLVQKSWGGDLIERLKQMEPTGRKIGESWESSAYPGNSSKIMVKGVEVPLIHLLNQASDSILGETVSRKFRGEMPILLKFIDSKSDLSVQVHPTDEQAEELDEIDSGKNEAWLIIDSKKGSGIYLGFKEDVSDIESIDVDKMNFVPVEPGDLFRIPAGTIHAIGNGIFLFEIQQSSNLTYRVWDWDRLPRRELHLKKAEKVINFAISKIDEFKVPVEKRPSKEDLLLDTPYFTLKSLKLTKGDVSEESTEGSFIILISLEGEVEVISGNEVESLCKGESLLVPASISSYKIKATSDARILKSW
ncbi:MAG: type I phosphomannose isomerase catalytic subunit, partial [Halobacteriota archaeon]|nr:type I phosphomannose isomerase catalytic subunit [Halobacteriota archaeon]